MIWTMTWGPTLLISVGSLVYYVYAYLYDKPPTQRTSRIMSVFLLAALAYALASNVIIHAVALNPSAFAIAFSSEASAGLAFR